MDVPWYMYAPCRLKGWQDQSELAVARKDPCIRTDGI